MGDAIEDGYENIAFVGLPCHVQSLRNIQMSKNFTVDIDRVKIIIGLFCMETFDLEVLARVASDEGLRMEDVKKFDIHKGRFHMITDEKKVTIGMKKMREHARDACKVCYDLSAEFADISVGGTGTARDWSTVILRSDEAENIFNSAEDIDVIETIALDKKRHERIRDLAAYKKSQNLKTILSKSDDVKLLNLSIDPEQLRGYLAV